MTLPVFLEMGSGAEKTIAAMAIRLALLTVSSIPKGDIFILDDMVRTGGTIAANISAIAESKR